MKAVIKQNRYDNWYGYLGGKRVIAFGNSTTHTAEQVANEWLSKQEGVKAQTPEVQSRIDHRIDMAIPEKDWQGYWCPTDQKYHKDGTEIFFNMHCITCKEMLTRKHVSGLVVNG